MSKLNVRSSFTSTDINPILKQYGIVAKKFDDRREEMPKGTKTTDILEELIEEAHISNVMVSVIQRDGEYVVTVANEPDKMCAHQEHRMRMRLDMAKSYINWPTDFHWDILAQDIVSNELAIPQRLMDIAELCAFDEDTDKETLMSMLEDIRERLQTCSEKLNAGERI